MIVGVPREIAAGERRVALAPAVIPSLNKAGIEVLVEAGAGLAAGFSDAQFTDKGAKIAANRDDVFKSAAIIAQVRALGAACSPTALSSANGQADFQRLRSGQTLVAMCDPLSAPAALGDAAKTGATIFALELAPRSTRAQSMDVLSSQASIAGYRAVLIAALALPKIFPMMNTAAGTITPAKVFVIGAGVAGLQAIATARRLGAVVSGYDVRPAVKDQVQSLGAKFVEMELDSKAAEGQGGYAQAMDEEFYRRQRELMGRVVAESDVVITTAAIPGKQSPILVTADMVRRMSPGAVIVDLAAERGGNCELTVAGQTIERHGVTIIGPLHLAAEAPFHASQMFGKNMAAFLAHLVRDGKLCIDRDDEITRETLVVENGQVVHPRVKALLS